MIHLRLSVILKSKEGKFLLQLRDNKNEIQAPNKWSLFGGGIEKGESPKNAAVREMKEELELNLKERDLFPISLKESKNNKHHFFFLKKEINLKKLRLHEGQARKLFSRREIIWMRRVTLETRLFFIFHKLK